MARNGDQPAPEAAGLAGRASPSRRAARQSCRARSRRSTSRSSRIMRSMSSRIYGYTTNSLEPACCGPRLTRVAARG